MGRDEKKPTDDEKHELLSREILRVIREKIDLVGRTNAYGTFGVEFGAKRGKIHWLKEREEKTYQ